MKDISQYHGDGSLLHRIKIVTTIFPLIMKKLYFGYGPGIFNHVWEQMMYKSKMSPHFDLLSITFELGIIGLFLYLLFICSSARLVWKNIPNQIGRTLILSLILLFIVSTFNTPTYKTEILLVFNIIFWGFISLYSREKLELQ